MTTKFILVPNGNFKKVLPRIYLNHPAALRELNDLREKDKKNKWDMYQIEKMAH